MPSMIGRGNPTSVQTRPALCPSKRPVACPGLTSRVYRSDSQNYASDVSMTSAEDEKILRIGKVTWSDRCRLLSPANTHSSRRPGAVFLFGGADLVSVPGRLALG